MLFSRVQTASRTFSNCSASSAQLVRQPQTTMLSIACGLQILGEKCADTPRGNERSSEKKAPKIQARWPSSFCFGVRAGGLKKNPIPADSPGQLLTSQHSFGRGLHLAAGQTRLQKCRQSTLHAKSSKGPTASVSVQRAAALPGGFNSLKGY